MIEGRGGVSSRAGIRARTSRWTRNIFKPSILGKLLREAFARWGGEEPAAAQMRRQSFTLEAIEPRLLLSADLSYAALSGTHDFTVKASDDGGGNYSVNLYETSNLLSSIASKSFTGGSDVSVSIARDDTLGAPAFNADTVRFDLDTFSALDTPLSGHSLTLDVQGGTERAFTDHVIADGSGATIGYSLAIQSSSDISSDATLHLTAGDLTLKSEQTASELLTTGLWADTDTAITLTGAHFTLDSGALNLTAHSDVTVNTDGTGMSGIQGAAISSFSGATIDIGGSSVLSATDINLNAKVDGTLTASAAAASVKLVAVLGSADPEVRIHGSSSLTASNNISALAKSDVTISASTSPETGSGTSSVDAAVVNTTYGSGATLSVSDSATVNATGTATLTASSKLHATTTADANVASTAGAAVAVSVITGDTTGSVSDATVDGSAISLGATSDRTITTLAKSSPGGSSAHTGGTPNKSETTLSDNNASTRAGNITVAG